MDYGKQSVEDIRKGYLYDESKEAYVCSYCGRSFPEGEVFPLGERFLMPQRAIETHIEEEHEGSLTQLLESTSKYNTFTDTQKELLSLIGKGMSDSEISSKLGIKAATVRHQKFTFREKAKQAKYYLAAYEEAFGEQNGGRGQGGKQPKSGDDIVSIPNTATMLDDRYVMTEKEKQKILNAEFESLDPLRLKKYPVKAKKQVAVLSRVAEEFEFGRKYTYKEMQEILSPITPDYSFFTRYLVDYGFMDRTKDGSEYWLK